MYKFFIPILLICTFLVSGCLDDDAPKDIVEEISMVISSETGIMYPPFFEEGAECMLAMPEDSRGEWIHLGFNEIKGFTYERGHEYELLVIRTILANPPMDSSGKTYTLKSILYDKLVVEPEVPIEKEIQSEDDIEYQELCPFEKYAVENEFTINEDGNIFYPDGSPLPTYNNARIYLKNILDDTDLNWVKFHKIPYQATYSYVFSPLTDEIRLVRNETSGPMFKNVIPEDEFTYITQEMKSGEELKYTLILANVHKKGLQKLEFRIRKL